VVSDLRDLRGASRRLKIPAEKADATYGLTLDLRQLSAVGHINRLRQMARRRQHLPQVDPRADVMMPEPAVLSSPLDDPRVRQPGPWIARDVDNTAALEREVIRHAAMLGGRDDAFLTRW